MFIESIDMDKYFIKLQDKIFCVLQLFSFRGKYDSDMFWQVVLYTLLIVLIPTRFMSTYAFLVGGIFCFYIILAAYQKRLRYMGRKGTWHIIILSVYAMWCFLSVLLPENKFIQDDKGLPFIIFAFSFAELEGTKTPENDKDISNPLLLYPFLYLICFVSVTALLWYLLSR